MCIRRMRGRGPHRVRAIAVLLVLALCTGSGTLCVSTVFLPRPPSPFLPCPIALEGCLAKSWRCLTTLRCTPWGGGMPSVPPVVGRVIWTCRPAQTLRSSTAQM